MPLLFCLNEATHNVVWTNESGAASFDTRTKCFALPQNVSHALAFLPVIDHGEDLFPSARLMLLLAACQDRYHRWDLTMWVRLFQKGPINWCLDNLCKR
jgi:hypothetical protein